jgi:hypothetical protein
MASTPNALATAQAVTTKVGAMVPLGQISSVVQTLSNIQGFNPGAFSQLSGTIQSALSGVSQVSSIVEGFAAGSPADAVVNALGATGLAGSSISAVAGAAASAFTRSDSFLSNLAQAESWAKLNSGRPSVEESRAANRGINGTLFFPQDIGKYWISLQFESANYNSIMGSQMGYFVRKNNGGVILPVPINLVDSNKLDYTPIQLTNVLSEAAQGAAQSIANSLGNITGRILGGLMQGSGPDAASALTGLAINTHQTLKFKQPYLKEHSFTWKLVPSNPKEAQTLTTIINYIKSRIYPRANMALFKYPDLVNVVLFNGNEMFFFKPAYVQSFAVNYTTENGPAFHKDKYPVSVQIDMTITENAVWTANDFGRQPLGTQEAIDLAKLPFQSTFGGGTVGGGGRV